ncbi:scaffolding protein [Cohnella xylanilytica]|uniref:Scaffolding protein n=1 Tax=Cohnella xylanilytica TaxID=557555 RepID=A0A841TP41_9BACL|nr:scaffolding protein [Cohnella xylanilytica]MBB6689915.1 scaffolding protein [Cohnella xylanilytica]
MFELMARPYRLRMNLQLFAGDGGGSGGSGGDGGSSGGSGGDGGGEKTFTQAELDQHVQTRVARAEKAAQKALAKELGYDSVEAMQAALKKPEGGKGKDGDGATLTIEDVEKRAKELLEASQKDQAEKTFQRLLRAEVKVLANELGFADWEDAAALADLSKVKENDKGELEGVKEALEELLKKKPHLGKQKPGSGAFGAEVRGGGSPDDRKKALDHMAELAKKEGTHTVAANDPWGRK